MFSVIYSYIHCSNWLGVQQGKYTHSMCLSLYLFFKYTAVTYYIVNLRHISSYRQPTSINWSQNRLLFQVALIVWNIHWYISVLLCQLKYAIIWCIRVGELIRILLSSTFYVMSLFERWHSVGFVNWYSLLLPYLR